MSRDWPSSMKSERNNKVFVLLQNVETNFFLGVLKNILKILDDIFDDVLVLVQHPVPLLKQMLDLWFLK